MDIYFLANVCSKRPNAATVYPKTSKPVTDVPKRMVDAAIRIMSLKMPHKLRTNDEVFPIYPSLAWNWNLLYSCLPRERSPH